MKSKRVSIILVNFNNAEDTIACLKSLEKIKSRGLKRSVVVIDNASTDKSVTQILKAFPKLNLIRAASNKGFAGGCNLGIKYALEQKSDYVLLLNNDTLISDPKMIDKLIDVKAAISSAQLNFQRNNKILYDLGGRVDLRTGRTWHEESSEPNQIPEKDPDFISGACMLIAKKVFNKIGYFDEKYFLYYEDVDFCIRARQAGFKLKLVTETSLFHHLSHSTNKLGKAKGVILLKSHRLFVDKFTPVTYKPLAYLYHLWLSLRLS